MKELINQKSEPVLFIVFICLFFSCQIHSQTGTKRLTPLKKLDYTNIMDLNVDTTNVKVHISTNELWEPFASIRENKIPISVSLNNEKEERNFDSLTNENTRNHYRIFEILNKNKSLCSNFEKLRIIGYNIDSIDFSIFPDLQILYIAFSPFNELPESIKSLSHLKSIRFAECGLNEVPKVVFQLKNLEELYLGDYMYGANNIKGFPKETANLSQLKVLFMPHNKLKCLSAELCELQSLE